MTSRNKTNKQQSPKLGTILFESSTVDRKPVTSTSAVAATTVTP